MSSNLKAAGCTAVFVLGFAGFCALLLVVPAAPKVVAGILFGGIIAVLLALIILGIFGVFKSLFDDP